MTFTVREIEVWLGERLASISWAEGVRQGCSECLHVGLINGCLLLGRSLYCSVFCWASSYVTLFVADYGVLCLLLITVGIAVYDAACDLSKYCGQPEASVAAPSLLKANGRAWVRSKL